MSKFNYGNSFSSFEGENVGVERISVWKSVREFFPGGAVLTAEEYNSSFVGNPDSIKPGNIVPAGTPIYVDKPGGKAKLSNVAETCIGLTYEDVVLGTDASTFTIVTCGEFLESRYQTNPDGIVDTLTEKVKTRLFGRISFIKEV